MKQPLLATLCLMLTPFLAHAAEKAVYDKPAANMPAGMEHRAPDTTDINKRDRNEQSLTPMDQSNTEGDINITKDLRKSIMKHDFSTDAKNIKIITRNGEVTLRGPVKSVTEKDAIAKLAKAVPGIKMLNNELEVK